MVSLKKYNLKGKEVGDVVVDDALLEVSAHPQMVKDYIVALRANTRQWSANTRGRSEVKHTTKKPYRQKGTGGARHGSLVTAQYRGGGIVFGPKPKFDQHVRINKKEKRLAIHSLLVERIKNGKVTVVEDAAFATSLKKPKTAAVADFLKARSLDGSSVLFIGDQGTAKEGASQEKPAQGRHAFFKLSLQNIPKVHYNMSANISGYDLIASAHLVLTESAVGELVNLYRM